MEYGKVKAPWLQYYGIVPQTLEYSMETLSGGVVTESKRHPDYYAYSFFGKRTTYAAAVDEIKRCATALRATGVRENERVTICLPNCPQAVTIFYAVNMIGAIANMVHPLSGQKEIEFYLNDSKSVAAITMDQFYGKFAAIRQNVPTLKYMMIVQLQDALPPLTKVGYMLTKARKIPKIPADADVIFWKDLMARGSVDCVPTLRKPGDPAVILYSGGTTGVTKGILLSNLNFNALAAQIVATNPMFEPGDRMLAIMPMFHGFGLGVSIHSMLFNGGECILVPQFTPKTYAELLKKYKPNFIAGVPTLFEALLRLDGLEKLDLSCLKGMFSGGDSLSVELKKRVDQFLKAHNASIEVREGYGTTECVTASCLTPYNMSKEGSIGIPFPDTYYKIVKVGTEDEVPYGEEGEICLAGPTVMLEYVGHPEETANTLRRHTDGLTWVHTGDLGIMDEDGFVYFRQRIKRMIITSGYNVYPSQLENILDANEYVHLSCVIGVKDPYRVQRTKAFVVLKPGVEKSEEVREKIREYCAVHMAKYAVPKEIEFRDELPKTLVGKVAYRILEEEEAQKEENPQTHA